VAAGQDLVDSLLRPSRSLALRACWPYRVCARLFFARPACPSDRGAARSNGTQAFQDAIEAGLVVPAGVDTRAFRVFDECRTPVNAVLIPPDRERYIFRFAGDALPSSAEWIDESTIAGAQCILIDVRWPEAALKMAAAARRLHVPVVVDWDPATPTTWDLIRHATHVIADEEAALSQGGPQALLDRFQEY